MTSDLEDLDRKLEQASKASEHAVSEQKRKDADNMGVGVRAGTELIGSIVVGVFLGWALDNWLHTKPLFLIIMFLLGVITGFVNVWRTTQNIGSQVGYSQLHKQAKPAKNPADKGESE